MLPKNLSGNGNGKGNKLSVWISRILLLLLIGGAVVVGVAYRDQVAEAATRLFAPADEDPIPVLAVKKTPFQLEVPSFGEITGLESTAVPTPSLRWGSLKVAWLIPEGTMVDAGDVLARYDPTEARLNLERQQNTLQSTDTNIDLQRNNQTTNEKLLDIDRKDAQAEFDYATTVMPQDEDIFSKWEIIEAQINANLAKEKMGFVGEKLKVSKKSAKADLQILSIDKNRAQTEIGIAQQTLDSLELKAPKPGLVVYRRERMREPQVGDEVMGGQVQMELVDLSMLEAKIYILEMDAGQIAKEQPVVVRLDSIPGKELHGTLKSIASLAMSRERNSPLKYFECEVLITDAGADLRRIKPGMALKANIILDKYDSVFVVPNSSLTFKDGKYTAYIQKGKTFTEREVKVGSGNHGQTVVLDGLQDNELVAMRNPFEARKVHLPDFSKAGAEGGREMRMMIMGGPPGGGGGMRGGH